MLTDSQGRQVLILCGVALKNAAEPLHRTARRLTVDWRICTRSADGATGHAKQVRLLLNGSRSPGEVFHASLHSRTQVWFTLETQRVLNRSRRLIGMHEKQYNHRQSVCSGVILMNRLTILEEQQANNRFSSNFFWLMKWWLAILFAVCPFVNKCKCNNHDDGGD